MYIEVISGVEDNDRDNVRNCVRRDGHKLGCQALVSQPCCETRRKQTQAREWRGNAEADSVMCIESPIRECFLGLCLSEVFAIAVITFGYETQFSKASSSSERHFTVSGWSERKKNKKTEEMHEGIPSRIKSQRRLSGHECCSSAYFISYDASGGSDQGGRRKDECHTHGGFG